MLVAGALLGAAPPVDVVRQGERAPLEADLGAQERMRVLEPLEGRVRTFEGWPVLRVLDRALGPSWRTRDEVIFHCADGYAARVDVPDLLEYRPLLAVGAADGPFRARSGEEAIDLEPSYLVWPSLDRPELQERGAKGWAYQVVALEAAAAGAGLEPLTLPPGASPAAERGLTAFRRHCVACHAINGAGGRVGPELNYPVSVTTYMRPAWLKVWLLSPKQIRAGTAMPGLPEDLPDRNQVAEDILAYLRAMRRRKLPTRGAR